MKHCFFLSLLIHFSSLSQSGTLTVSGKPKADTTYIQSYKNYLTIGILSAAPLSQIYIEPRKTNSAAPSPTTEYQANISNSVGITVGYRSIYAALAFRTPVEASSIEQYGTTSYKSFALRLQKPKFFVSFEYRNIKGFYRSDSIVSVNQDVANYLHKGDLSSKQFMLSGIYNFNWKKFSYLAPLIYTERQIKSKAGFLIKSSISTNSIQSGTSIIDSSDYIYYKNVYNIEKLNYLSVKAGPGLGLNGVIRKRFYASLMLFYSLNFVAYRFTDINNNRTPGQSMSGFIEGRASIGYQSKRFYIGIKFIGDQLAFKTEDAKITSSFGIVTFDIGYRFKAPGILKKGYDATFARYLGL